MMLLQITVLAVNMVKVKTLVCDICTLVCTITQACNSLPSQLKTILSSPCGCVNIIFANESLTDWSLLGQTNSLIFF